MSTTQVAGSKPRLYQDLLNQNAESTLIRTEMSPFSLFLPLASNTVLRTLSNSLILLNIRSHEVSRPHRFGLKCSLFVDFGSWTTNPKLSTSGAAIRAAVFSLLGGIG